MHIHTSLILYIGVISSNAFPQLPPESDTIHEGIDDHVEAFFDAVKNGNIGTARKLITSENVNTADEDGITMLHWAIENDQGEILKILLENGANLNAKDKIGDKTPIYVATKKGNKEIVRLLVENGANFNVADEAGQTPLHLAVIQGEADNVRCLLGHGADVNAHDTVGSTSLHRVAEKNLAKIAEILIEHGINMNIRDVYGCTALHRVAEHDNVEMANLLIKKGAQLNIKDNYGDTPLGWAEAFHSRKVIPLLEQDDDDHDELFR